MKPLDGRAANSDTSEQCQCQFIICFHVVLPV
jgi:hypothetical protein